MREEASAVPTDGDRFIEWVEGSKASGPGQGDPLYPWLAEAATVDQLRRFFDQKAAGEAGFDDLVAMTQVKLPIRPKLGLARDYWGQDGAWHRQGHAWPDPRRVGRNAGGTAGNRRHVVAKPDARQRDDRHGHLPSLRVSVGALGVIELTAPGRSAMVWDGLKRLGFSGKERRYFALHFVLDAKHSEDRNREAIRSAVEKDLARAVAMAEGALIRPRCGERAFAAYRAALWAASAA